MQSVTDLCFYTRVDADNIVYLIVYVNDFLIAAKDIQSIK